MISIIVPTYNRASLIPRLLKSIQNQKFRKWELIIMDDGSVDETALVMKPFLEDDRIKYFQKENTGATHSRNEGVNQASFKWITFFDSDDEAKEDWLSSMVGLLQKPKVGIVFCGMQKHDAGGKMLGVSLPTYSDFFPQVMVRFNAGTFIILKEAFQKIGGYDPDTTSGQQTELSLRLIPYLLDNNYSFEYVMQPLIKVHGHEGIRITNNDNARYLGSTGTLKKHEAIFKKNKGKYYDYVSVAGVRAIKTDRIKEGKKLLFKAITINPLSGVAYFRYAVSYFPWIRKRIWKRKK